jgi:hypothetical protein
MGEIVAGPLFNLTDISRDQYPTMSLCVSGREWLAEMANPDTWPYGGLLTQDEGDHFLLPSFLPPEAFESVDTDKVPSIVDGSFCRNLEAWLLTFLRESNE